ncbi:MAG: MATE family efflux transporter [Oscillospiraceae bacterium]|nr:MATE family efflux transporter [Oscillospiraceae bacterium]
MKKISRNSQNNRIDTTLKMTEGSPYKLICRFAIPILLSHIFQQLYNTADAFIVGRFLGTNALAAVSSSGTLIFLMTSFFVGMAMGGGVIISRNFGAGDDAQLSRAVHTMITLGLICGLALTVVGVTLTPTFLVWMNTDPDVLPEAIEYFRYYFLGSIAMIMYNMCNSILNAVGDSRRPLIYLITSSLINIVLDVVFVGVFRWGVWSAAVATVIAQAASLILSLSHLMKKGHVFTVEIRKLRIHKDVLKEILRYGLPSAVQNSVIALANVVVQSQINSFGKLAMAAYGTHAKIEGFAFLPITSFNMAMTTFISQNLGARKHDRAKKGARFGIIAAVLLAEAIGVLCYTFSPFLIGLFDSNPGVIELGVLQSRTVSLFFCLLAFSHSIAAVCRGAGKAFVPMIIMLVVWCGIRIAYIITVMHLFGEIRFIYWAYPLTWAISSVIYLIYYLCSDWVHGFEKTNNKNAKQVS